MSAIARLYDRLHDLLAAAAALLIAFVAVGIAVDVVIRNTGFGVLAWMLEAAEYSLFLATFLGAPWVLRQGAHVRVDVVVDGLRPALKRGAEVLADVIGLAVSGALLYYSARVAWTAHVEGARAVKTFVFPEWWIFAVIAFSSTLLIVEFLLRLWRVFRAPDAPAAPRASDAAL